jgi:hypothetical protein
MASLKTEHVGGKTQNKNVFFVFVQPAGLHTVQSIRKYYKNAQQQYLNLHCYSFI